MFLHLSVSHSGHVGGGMCDKGGMHGEGGMHAGETATEAGDTHPTGIHCCFP